MRTRTQRPEPSRRLPCALATATLCCLLLWSAPVSAQFGTGIEKYEIPRSMRSPHLGECNRITRQIARYADVAQLARDRGDDRWEEHTIQHIGRLSERRARLCPAIYAEKPIGHELAKILRDAGKIALKLFRMGLI